MRFKSSLQKGYRIYAVSGVNTISFAIDFEKADTADLLGFAVERDDPKDNERYYMYGFKVFKELVPDPGEYMLVSTFDNPVQSFVWDDFTAKPEYEYTYYFYPVKGRPKKLIREKPVTITVKAEPLYSQQEHDVFFNRGVASSQAYARKFNNLAPDKLQGQKKAEALQWLSRDLDDAILKFISQAKRGDTLRGCFYEFSYAPVLAAFKQAIDNGVNVKLIIDAKVNEYTDSKGVFHQSFPREENLVAIRQAGISEDENIIKREARKSDIQHNKFIVFLEGVAQHPRAVWTGSTNISMGGIMGQTNVGHWIRDENIAAKYARYWEILSRDPGGKTGDGAADVRKKNDEFKQSVMALQNDIDVAGIPVGITPVFSPRKGLTMLNTYAAMVDTAKKSAAITLAFGINKVFKELLKDDTEKDRIVFMLLEKKDLPNSKNKDTFITLGAKNNVYQAYGSYLKDPLYAWTKAEVNTRIWKLNTHVAYVHTKILLMDPLSSDPVIVTGSANFSESSINDNDENTVIIRRNLRAADIYFTEFNRLFNHYYYRSVIEELREKSKKGNNKKDESNKEVYLRSDATWQEKYQAGKFRYKRLQMFREMEGIVP
jgi:phosphatidylserine/phosphatidylglycerophosphate/cardiolipin synthase-like enzyme